MSESLRPNPDALLRSIEAEDSQRRRGRLKVFLGMCPGVGKTYAMLEAARREVRSGRSVLLGLVETHQRTETAALLDGLPILPRRCIEYRGVRLEEFDLDAALDRRPELVLVDELAHTNVPGSRHPKRWHDVQELLDAGIDVFTTLNVQHVESRADTVRQITGTDIRETVPDSVLDGAVLELVDLPPAELLQRLREGRVYLGERAGAAAEHFFRESNLTALRELALRLVADHVGEDTRFFRRSETRDAPWKTSHRLLVAVGPSPTSETLIRWTRRVADSLHCPWIAVHVEGPRPLAGAAQEQLSKNLATARELGAEVITTADVDLVHGVVRTAREQNVTQIVVGKTGGESWLRTWRGHRMLRRLSEESGDIDLHVVRGDKSGQPRRDAPTARREPGFRSQGSQYALATAAVFGAGLANLAFNAMGGPRVPGLVFLLVVVVLALFVGRGPVLLAGALSALGWNFFFLEPRFTFAIDRLEDTVLLATYFVVAMVLGQLVARIREQAEAERRREARATALYELTRDLSEAATVDEVVWQLVAQVDRVLHARSTVAIAFQDTLKPHPDGSLELAEKELAVANWALRHRQAAGRTTRNLPGGDCLHLPLATDRKAFGVLIIELPASPLALGQRELLETFARQAAMVLDRSDLQAAAGQARLLAESERLARTLLNSISHELRTPLAVSTTAVAALRDHAQDPDPALRESLLAEIQQANARLNRIVGNLLDVTRLESGQIRPRLDWHDARDLVQTVIREWALEPTHNLIHLHLPAEPLLARLDYSLMQQALGNLLLNAITHTPEGTPIEIGAELADNALVLTVADRGPGIPPDLLPRLFLKFNRGTDAHPGGTGLGLAIVKGLVEAHGGTVTAQNRPQGGSLFTLRLPQSSRAPTDHGS
ncbi:MAG: sensor histidine kinase KdpD [Verrucomicrobiales bacterium]|nr:sensor histidine kinase KdpD [Verrucomicrobiales bacterium]